MDLQQNQLAEDEAPFKAKRGVQFRSRNSIEQVRRISRISMYDEEEVVAYWGDDSEHKLSKQELRKAVVDCQTGRRNSDNFTFTTRGIADKIGEGRAVKKENRLKSRYAVMFEQDLQDLEGVRDEELLADVYTVSTISAKLKAHKEALSMAEDVEKLSSD